MDYYRDPFPHSLLSTMKVEVLGTAKKRPALPRRNGELKQLEREAKASFSAQWFVMGRGVRVGSEFTDF